MFAKKVVVHVSCELRRRKIVTETRMNELGENWLRGLLRNFFFCNITHCAISTVWAYVSVAF